MPAGSCLCGAVQFQIIGPMRPVLACHCQQCRKQTGHYFAATSVPNAAIEMTQDTGLAWFRASDMAQRGFCKLCGSTLFWKPDDGDHTSVGAGTLDAPTGLKMTRHVFVADKGDYYDIADDLPRHAQFSGAKNA